MDYLSSYNTNRPQFNVQFSARGVSIPALLTLLFVVLKLVGVISWSWVWVLAPMWISIAAGIAFITLFFTIAIILVAVSNR